MAGTAGCPQPPRLPVRASHAEREDAVAALRERFVSGQLSKDTFVHRMETALAARDRGQLAELFADLPAPWRLRAPAWRELAWRELAWRAPAWRAPAWRKLAWLASAWRAPAWRKLAWRELAARMASRSRALLAPLRDAMAAPPRGRARPHPIGLRFPAGSQPRFIIGRDPGCDLVIADISVSRLHAGLDRCEGGWRLTDLGSTNGTRLNGWRVREPVPVRPGDRVSFGAVTVFFVESHAVQNLQSW